MAIDDMAYGGGSPGAPDIDMATGIRNTAQNLGINPSDLGTAISYETGGKMDHNLYGGAGGKHLGLIQFGPEEQKKYGVTPGMSLGDHFSAVENYLRDRGIKPGMGMLDLYSTINAGRPGRYNASDANNGGAPGTVADKVAEQMYAHRLRADKMLGGGAPAAAPAAPAPAGAPMGALDAGVPAPAPAAPLNIQSPAQVAATTPNSAGINSAGVNSANKPISLPQQQPQQQAEAPIPLATAQPPGLPKARILADAMARLGQSMGQA